MKKLHILPLILLLLAVLPSCNEELMLVIHNRSERDVGLKRKGWVDFDLPNGSDRRVPLSHFLLRTTWIDAIDERWTYPDAAEALNAVSMKAARSYVFRNEDGDPEVIIRLGDGGRLDLLRREEGGKIVRPREQPPGFPLWPFAMGK